MHRHSCPNRINRLHQGTVSHVVLCKISTCIALHVMPSAFQQMKGNKYVKQIHGLLTVLKKRNIFFSFSPSPKSKGITGQTMMGKTNWKNTTSNLVIHISFFFFFYQQFRMAVMTLQLLEYLTFMLFKKLCVVFAFPRAGQQFIILLGDPPPHFKLSIMFSVEE